MCYPRYTKHYFTHPSHHLPFLVAAPSGSFSASQRHSIIGSWNWSECSWQWPGTEVLPLRHQCPPVWWYVNSCWQSTEGTFISEGYNEIVVKRKYGHFDLPWQAKKQGNFSSRLKLWLQSSLNISLITMEHVEYLDVCACVWCVHQLIPDTSGPVSETLSHHPLHRPQETELGAGWGGWGSIEPTFCTSPGTSVSFNVHIVKKCPKECKESSFSQFLGEHRVRAGSPLADGDVRPAPVPRMPRRACEQARGSVPTGMLCFQHSQSLWSAGDFWFSLQGYCLIICNLK